MRRIDWEGPLSDEDIVWLRQAGILGIEDKIRVHQAQFDAEVPEAEVPDDTVTLSTLDPSARAKGEPVGSESGPLNVSPEPGTVQAGDAFEDLEADDYESWKLPELRNEVTARNELAVKDAAITSVEVVGTGENGAIRKADLVKALRVWDQENPEPVES